MFDFMHISDFTGEYEEEEQGLMKAIVIKEIGKVELVDVKKPRIKDNYVRVKTTAVALNWNDVQNVTSGKGVGSILGCDFSGIVEAVGRDCESSVSPGDKVYGVCGGTNKNNTENGAFAEFVLVQGGHFAKLPQGRMTFEGAATLGTGIMAVGQALYSSLNIPLPMQPTQIPFPILINGGSTATGTLAIQYAKLSGLRVIATSSPRNFTLLRSRGADAVFDYHDPQCAIQIKTYAQNRLHHILDCVSSPYSAALCAAAFPSSSTQELHFASLRPLENWPRMDVIPMVALAQPSFPGASSSQAESEVPATSAQLEFAALFWEMSERLVADGRIVPHPATVKEGGLEAIPDGLAEVAARTLSGSRLVFNVA